MSPLTELGLVLLGLYVVEGFRRAPRGAFGFARKPWGGIRLQRARAVRERSALAFLLPTPWVPALERFVACPWPFAVSPAGVSAAPDARWVTWEAAGSAEAAGSRLRFSDGSVMAAGSPEAARRWSDRLRELSRLAPEARERAIRERIALSFDSARAGAIHATIEDALKRARPLAWLVSLNLFLAGPVLARYLGWGVVLPGWVVTHVALTAWVVTLCRRIARARGDVPFDGRFETLLSMGLYPPAVARFLESFPAGAFADVDPVAVASVVSDRDGLLRVARARRAQSASAGPDRPVEAWFDDAVRREIGRVAARHGVSEVEILDPPQREPGSRSFCPRCRAQYRSGAARCADCPNVALIPYDEDPRRTFPASEVAP